MGSNVDKISQKIEIFSIILFLLIPFPSRTNAANIATTYVKVDPQVSSASLNETFSVNITVVEVQNLYGVEISLSWNETILQLINIDVRLNVDEDHPDGVLYGPVYWVNETSSKEYFLWGTSYDPAPPFNGSGNIVRLSFKVISVGNCTLDLESKLGDWPPPDRVPRVSRPIDHVTLDGVLIIPEFPSFIAIILFLIFVATIVIFSKLKLFS